MIRFITFIIEEIINMTFFLKIKIIFIFEFGQETFTKRYRCLLFLFAKESLSYDNKDKRDVRN